MKRPLRILHVFYDIVFMSGYRIRSKYILANQKKLGLDIHAVFLPTHYANSVVTSLGGVNVVPLDISGNGLHALLEIDKPIPALQKVQQSLKRHLFRGFVRTMIERVRPDIVHAHSAWMSAAPAFAAARAAGLPFLYEVRGFWEETGIAERKAGRLGPRYWYFRLRENYLIRKSDAVVVISDGLRREVISRGGDPDRITTIPNGVDTEDFAPIPRDGKLAEALGLGSRTVVGYISSLRKMEGVRYLLEALRMIDPKAIALIVGDGPEKTSLQRRARNLGVQDRVIFVGAVPHSETMKYYSIIDIFVVPRIKRKVCEIVTPLKPLEAMAMGKCLLMGDVGGLRELTADAETAVFFEPENGRALAAKLNALIKDDEQRRKMGENARRCVVENRDWRRIVEGYLPAYERLKG